MSLSSMELESSLFRSSTAKSVAFLTVYKHIEVHLKGKSVRRAVSIYKPSSYWSIKEKKPVWLTLLLLLGDITLTYCHKFDTTFHAKKLWNNLLKYMVIKRPSSLHQNILLDHKNLHRNCDFDNFSKLFPTAILSPMQIYLFDAPVK